VGTTSVVSGICTCSGSEQSISSSTHQRITLPLPHHGRLRLVHCNCLYVDACLPSTLLLPVHYKPPPVQACNISPSIRFFIFLHTEIIAFLLPVQICYHRRSHSLRLSNFGYLTTLRAIFCRAALIETAIHQPPLDNVTLNATSPISCETARDISMIKRCLQLLKKLVLAIDADRVTRGGVINKRSHNLPALICLFTMQLLPQHTYVCICML